MALRWRNDWYFHVAQANDQNSTSTKLWYIGKADATTQIITTTLTMDWTSSISGLKACLSGRWFMDDGDTYPRVIVPCTTTDNPPGQTYQMYESHATAADWSTNTASWSAPVQLTVTGKTNIYDPKIWHIGSTYYMWYTAIPTGFCIELATASSLTGTYTPVKTGNWAGWGLSSSVGACSLEGPTMFYTGSGWTLQMEINQDTGTSATGYKFYYATCDGTNPATCTWSGRTLTTEEMLLRHGDVWLTPGPENGAALLGGGGL